MVLAPTKEGKKTLQTTTSAYLQRHNAAHNANTCKPGGGGEGPCHLKLHSKKARKVEIGPSSPSLLNHFSFVVYFYFFHATSTATGWGIVAPFINFFLFSLSRKLAAESHPGNRSVYGRESGNRLAKNDLPIIIPIIIIISSSAS